MFDSLAHRVCLGSLGALMLTLSACSSLDGSSNRLVTMVTPYKIDIVQGNFVSREQAAALKEGMSRNQVRDILGTPLLTSVFHADRWDYVFTFKRQGIEPQARRVTVFFKDDVLSKVQADSLPSEAEFVASLDSGRKTGPIPVLEMPPESLKPAAPAASAAAPVASAPRTTSYPPLETPSN